MSEREREREKKKERKKKERERKREREKEREREREIVRKMNNNGDIQMDKKILQGSCLLMRKTER